MPERVLSNLIELNTATEIGHFKMYRSQSGEQGGVALQIVAQGDGGSVTVDTENKIRRDLGRKKDIKLKNKMGQWWTVKIYCPARFSK